MVDNNKRDPFNFPELEALLSQLPQPPQPPASSRKDQLLESVSEVDSAVDQALSSLPMSDEDKDYIAKVYKDARTLMIEAAVMDEEGPEANSPLAKLLNYEDFSSALITIMMSLNHGPLDKCRMITALVLVAMKKYEIQP